MTRIDLVPPELVEKQRVRKIIVLMSAVFAAIFAVLVFLYAIIYAQAVVAGQRVDIIRQEKMKVETATRKLKPYQERKTILDSRKKIASTVTADQVYWSSILNSISMVIPNDVWLTQFKGDIDSILKAKSQPTGQQATQPPITLIGAARDNPAVARWLVHLSEVNQFRSVWLSYATEKDMEGTKTVEFETTVYLTKFKDSKETKK